ncbi:tetratricopeptide repeat-containing sensor histidine kinase [Ferruginibacter sp.]|nr:tetratricopeptide repeat-containing sensor histidine kinase [Ferruginibacter sp.]
MQPIFTTALNKILALAIMLMVSVSVNAQKHGQALIDSLTAQLPLAKNDTIKARLYKSIAEQYMLISPEAAMKTAEIGLTHVTKMKWSKGIAVFTNITGQLFVNKGDYKKAIELYLQAYAMHEGNKDYFNMASTLNNIGAAYQRQSMFTNAIEYFLRSAKLAEEIKDNNLIAIGYSNIGIIYSEQNNTAKALEYHFKALQLQQKENDIDAIATSFTRIANEYLLLKDSAKAEQYFLKAKTNYEQSENNAGLAAVLSNYSILIKDYRKNLEYKLQAQKIWDVVSPENPIAIANLGNIGIAYFDIVRYDSLHTVKPGGIIPVTKNELLAKANNYLTRAVALSKQTGNTANYAHFAGNLSELQELNKDYKNALLNFKTFYQLNDSLYSQESKNKIAAIESQREIDIRNKEIENKKLQLENQHKKLLLLLDTIAFLAIVGGLLFYQSRSRKKTNTTLLQLNNELDEANKVKAKFFAILSHDLRSPVANLINFLQLQKRNPGLLSPQQIEDRENKISTSAQSLLETMEGMLLWSKGQMEQFKPEVTTVPASKLFSYLQKNFADTPNVTFNFINDGDVYMNTDPDYLQTIMQNLTANAIKALQQTSAAQITWKAWQQNNTIYLSITDNGPGINSEQAKSLFDETHITGTRHGLGLHIIRDLAKAISCSINIIPGNKQGTTFVLAL